MRRRVVITGVGAVSGFGVGAKVLWEGLCSQKSAISKPTRVDLSGFPCQLAAEVKDFSAKDYVPKHYRKAVKVMARDVELAVAAAKDAVEDAGLLTRANEGQAPTYPGERVGCQIGAGLIAAETHELTLALATAVDDNPANANRGGFSYKKFGTVTEAGGGGGMDNLQPLWMLKYLPNMLACHVTIIHGCEGPSNTHTCSEASGLLSIGEGTRVIERGAADVTISGSAESKVNLLGVLRMTVAGRFGNVPASTKPEEAVIPYSGNSGSVPGEGAGLLILEHLDTAQARGKAPYAEVLGFGAAHSFGKTTPGAAVVAKDSVNEGLVLAINNALRDAGVKPDAIDAIVPQACGSACMDIPEAGALRQVFGSRLETIDLVTLAPAVGDCCAGTGGVQVAAAAMMLKEQTLPARIGSEVAGLAVGPAEKRKKPLRHVLVCTSSLGGQNAALVLRSVAP